VKGTLTPSYTPYIDLEVVEAGSLQEMVVDTGFNDYLYLPEDIIVDWNLPFITTSVVSYADGTTAVSDLYEATVIWFGVTKRVTALAGPVGCDDLVGMRLLAGCRIELDEQKGEVRIEQL
jgi:clan AA aspartic protease